MSDTLVALLQQRLSTDPAQPFVTVVADEGRVELSAATVGNWVAKTAGLIAHDLALPTDAVIDIDVPLGWQAIAWQHAIWRAGCVLGFGTTSPDLVVRDELTSEGAATTDVVRVGRHLLGMPITPAPVADIDWSSAARTMPDRFAAPLPLTAATALVREGQTLTHADLAIYARDLAARWQVGSHARVLVDAKHPPVDAWLGIGMVPVVTAGSVVVWTAEREPTGADLTAEGVTSVAR